MAKLKQRMAILALGFIVGMALPPAKHTNAANIEVTRLDDPVPDGCAPKDCSLREAIIAANSSPGPDTINLSAGTYVLSIAGPNEDAGASGDLDINRSLSIVGAGPSSTVIDGGGLDRVFEVAPAPEEPAVVVSISSLTVQNGSADAGAGISSHSSSLTISDAIVRDSSATFGGGIYTDSGTASLSGSLVTSNQAVLMGGGVFNEYATLAIANTTITDNTGGGVVSFSGGTTLTIQGSTISRNTGGLQGGGVLNSSGHAVITNSVFDQNISSYGGGIFNHADSPSDRLDISGTTMSFNQAGSLGGAIGSENGGTVTITESELTANSAGDLGGAVWSGSGLVVTRSTVNGNRAGLGGGVAITEMSTGATVTNSTISANSAAGDGGGIYAESAVVSFRNVTATDNQADGDGNGTGDGGGVFQGSGSTVISSNSIVAGNTDTGGQAPDCFGTITSEGYNLVQQASGCALTGDSTGNIVGQSAELSPLDNNGGPTLTHALLPGSPATDAGNPAVPGGGGNACETTDQREVPRPQGPRCDIGAYENNPQSVGGVAELPDIAGAPLQTSGPPTNGARVLAMFVAALPAVFALGGAAWYARIRGR